jgi:hypothetical protein
MWDKPVTVPSIVIGELEELCFRRAFELKDEAEHISGGTAEWARERAETLFQVGLAMQRKRNPTDINPLPESGVLSQYQAIDNGCYEKRAILLAHDGMAIAGQALRRHPRTDHGNDAQMRLQIHIVARRIARTGPLGNEVDVFLAVGERN